MTKVEKCSICNNIVNVTSYTIEGAMCEEHFRCETCGYGYEFTYGACREFIEGVEYLYDDLDSGVDIAFHKARRRWKDSRMTFIGMLQIIFEKSDKPNWYKRIPWYRRFGAWRHSYANPLLVIKMYIRSKKR